MVVVTELPGGGRHANVPLLGLANGCDVGLVDDVAVLTPGSIHWAFVSPTTAVAVGVEGSLLGEGVGHHLGIVPTDDFGQVGHGPVTELDRVPIEDTVV